MKSKMAIFFTFFFTVLYFYPEQQPLFAQDTGDPVLRTIAFYTALGSAGGAAIGAIIFGLDPLNPEADFRDNILSGLGVGCFAGLAFGVYMLNQQVLLPYEEPPPISEFEGNASRMKFQRNPFGYTEHSFKNKKPSIQIFSFQYRF